MDHGDNKFRAINVSSPLSIQTTNNAYLTIQTDCYTKSEINSSLALKQNAINNVAGTGERTSRSEFLEAFLCYCAFTNRNIFKSAESK